MKFPARLREEVVNRAAADLITHETMRCISVRLESMVDEEVTLFVKRVLSDGVGKKRVEAIVRERAKWAIAEALEDLVADVLASERQRVADVVRSQAYAALVEAIAGGGGREPKFTSSDAVPGRRVTHPDEIDAMVRCARDIEEDS